MESGKLLLIYIVLISISPALFSQPTNTDNSPIGLSGRVMVNGDFYSMNADPADSVGPRRPSSQMRFIIAPTLSLGPVSLPFSLMFSTRQTNATISYPQKPDFWGYLKNPMNNFSMSPEYKWVRLRLGTFVPRYSEYTSGNRQLFGGGLELSPGRWRFLFSYGSSETATEPDSAEEIDPVYSQRTFGFKMGYGDSDSSHIHFNFIKSTDNANSLGDSVELFPEENAVTSLDYRLDFGSNYYLKGEFAASGFTRNTNCQQYDFPHIGFIQPIYETCNSSRFDAAGTMQFAKTGQVFGIVAAAKYIGPGFKSLNYPYLQSDRIEGTISPRLHLLENRLNLSGSAGYRINNLADTKAATSSRFIGRININGRITDGLNVSTGYSNFDFTTDDADSARVDNVTHSYYFAPSYSFSSGTVYHYISAGYSASMFRDNSALSDSADGDTRSITSAYNATFTDMPLTAGVSFSHFESDNTIGGFVSNTVGLNFAYSFLDRKLNPSIRLGFTSSKPTGFTSDKNYTANLGLRWRFANNLTLNLNAPMSYYVYGSQKPDVSFIEVSLRAGLSYDFQ